MATSAAARRRPGAATRAPAVRGIRWDRLGRLGLLAVLGVIVLLYVGPAHSFVSTLHEAKARRAEVAQLKRQNAELRARRAELARPGTLVREARRTGMVAPGERAYVVRGLPKGP